MEAIFLKILNMSITASWLVLAIIILRLLLKKAPKAISVFMWALVGVRLICPFSFESILSLIPSAETVPQDIIYSEAPTIHSGVPILNSTMNPIISESLAPEVGASVNPMQIIAFVASTVWIVGIVAMVLYTVVSYFRIHRKVREAVPYQDNIWLCDHIDTPFILGLVRPRIYLPSNMNEQDIEYVIAHEKAHLKRHDHWWKPLGFLLLTVYWFNPILWIAYTLLCKDIELACDEKVIKDMGTEIKKPYSEALINCSVPRKMISACPLAFGEVGVKGRVKSVLNYKKPAFWIIAVAVVASIVVAVCFLTNPRTTIDDELSVFLDMQIAEHHYSEGHTDDNFITVHHKVLDVDKGLTKTTVYMWVLYHEYSYENGEINLEAGAHTPTVITAKRTGSHGHYELVEYWTPRDGSYYAPDIKDKFPWHLHSKALDSQRYIAEQKEFCENAAKEHFSDSSNINNAQKLTWTYQPMLSYTGHSLKAFIFDFDYTHIEATCSEGELWSLEVEGQPHGNELHFENGKTVYWSPNEAVIENVPQKSEVTLAIYNEEILLHKCIAIFKCVSQNTASAEFEIYFKDADGLAMIPTGDGIKLIKSSSISNVGGADNPNNIIIEIIDRTVTEEIPTDEALQPFCIDENYIYSFPSIRSDYVIVKLSDGEEITVKNALAKGLITITDLDRWNIQYYKEEYNGDLEIDKNGDVVRISSYPKDLYYSTLGHFQTLYEPTPAEQIQEKYDDEEFVITKMHYYNNEKKWCSEGYTYKYRLEISGRLNNADKETTYIVLSNSKDITFEQTWKASGLSSLSTDYFNPTEAVIVGHKLFS